MPKANLYNQAGGAVGELDLNSVIFGQEELKRDLVHQIVVSLQANARSPVANTKTRGEVRGGGKKPWQQKGTGRARHGSIRSPLWRGGGITFGPRSNRNFSKKLSQKTKISGMRTVLSELAREKRIFVIESLDLVNPKTKELNEKIAGLRKALGFGRKIVIVVPEKQEKLVIAGRNLQGVVIKEARNLNILDLLSSHSIVILKAVLPVLEKAYGNTK